MNTFERYKCVIKLQDNNTKKRSLKNSCARRTTIRSGGGNDGSDDNCCIQGSAPSYPLNSPYPPRSETESRSNLLELQPDLCKSYASSYFKMHKIRKMKKEGDRMGDLLENCARIKRSFNTEYRLSR